MCQCNSVVPEGVVGEGREDGDDQEGVTFMIDKEGGGLAVDVDVERRYVNAIVWHLRGLAVDI